MQSNDQSGFTIYRAVFAAVTAIAAVVGVNLSPAGTSKDDLQSVVRAELAPVSAQVEAIAHEQAKQGQRIAALEAARPVTATAQ